jgi:GMP synthase-like glutamine amidotransferase
MEVDMNRLSRSFLVACLTALAVGLYVSFARTPLPSVLTVALPIGAICYGLFLISFVFDREFEHAERKEHGEIPSSAQQKGPPPEKESHDVAEITPHQPAHA